VSLPEGFHTAKVSGVSEGVALTSRRYAGGSMLGFAPVNSVVSSIDGICAAAERTFGESRIGGDGSAEIAPAWGSLYGRLVLPMRDRVIGPLQ
jgi:hypothetical protein